MMNTETKSAEVKWPDLSIDTRAWEMAKNALGTGATVSQIAAKAQSCKVLLQQALALPAPDGAVLVTKTVTESDFDFMCRH